MIKIKIAFIGLAVTWVEKYSGERIYTPHLAALNADLVLMCG
ncbi:hypothetical protein [Moritella yayanosii]|uniref:Uncharacterized protein n=1 Tax=Moritella yayanosii TaxID=69539 RepID=A0A330LR38_9GAMM|nr:protein of unknown function, might belong to Oxidoreductase [Moritella yayanosii]